AGGRDVNLAALSPVDLDKIGPRSHAEMATEAEARGTCATRSEFRPSSYVGFLAVGADQPAEIENGAVDQGRVGSAIGNASSPPE
ncbi:MAG: hypothetical protein WCA15_17385, partial [Candidatus Acidiferrales bacterium]